ncbi:MAG: type II toxin-antitoxin system RelE/ParE family toxin [Gallionellaceae bacterium]
MQPDKLLEWSKRAIEDMDSLYEYIKKENPKAAKETHERIESAADLIAGMPSMGTVGRYRKTLEHPVSKTDFTIIYKEIKQVLVIVRVLHQSRQLPKGIKGGGGFSFLF